MNFQEQPGGLIVLDADRRTYAGLSSDGSYWHLIQPLRTEVEAFFEATELVSAVAVGELVCTCAGARFKHNCYRLDQARLYEREIENALRWGLAAGDVPKENVPSEAPDRASRRRPAGAAAPKSEHGRKGTAGRTVARAGAHV